MTNVAVIGARGTIAGVSDTRVGFQRYTSGTLPITGMLDGLRPELDAVAEVTGADLAADHRTVPGLCALTRAVEEALASAGAAVVTTGTNELAEVAYWLDLTVRSPKPVVVTGAMRPWNVIGSDGPPNLYNAVLLAASGATAPFGPVVMLNDEIHTAREVVKSDTQRVHTFRSSGAGLGVMDRPDIRLHVPRERRPFDLSGLDTSGLPKVEIIPGYLDAGPEPLIAVAEAGVAGIVVAGFLSGAQKRAARDLAGDGVTFVAAPHTPSGAVHPESDAVIGCDLSPPKARLLLLLALARNPRDPRAALRDHGQPPAMAPTTRNGSFPSATASGRAVSGGSWERSSSQA